MPIDQQLLKRLRSQASRGELVLFTGAGFSAAARNSRGEPLPSAAELRRLLWEISFTEPLDDQSTLGEVFYVALGRNRSGVEKLLADRFTVDPNTIPAFFELFADFPWRAWYTLNVDDLPLALGVKFNPRRRLELVSATTKSSAAGAPDVLDVIALNGSIHDSVGSLTFSETAYADRINNREPLYSRCAADIIARPVIYIGTELREPPLWQHIALREQHIAGRDPRPTGLLVTPRLGIARREMLGSLKIDWLPATAEEFALEVLAGLSPAREAGFAVISRAAAQAGLIHIPLASELAAENPTLETEYLTGQEPHWSDILTGRAIVRQDDDPLFAKSLDILEGSLPSTTLAITGTAGTGKSTALKRLALRLSDRGIPVMWLDRDSRASVAHIRSRAREYRGSVALAIDDADLYGLSLGPLLRDLRSQPQLLVAMTVRAGKFDRLRQDIVSSDVPLSEHVIPNLTDSDIEALVATLDTHHRLGILKGKSKTERIAAFRVKAGRQLLVAMLEATSGEKFEDKVRSELEQLTGELRFVYSAICVASSFRHSLSKDEIQLASGDMSGEAITAIDQLLARHLIIAPPLGAAYFARHRVIAELVVGRLIDLRELGDIVAGLAFAAATKVDVLLDRRDRNWSFLARLLNHEFLQRTVGVMEARQVYSRVEKVLAFDYHYWLQRGSLEVQFADSRLAENFLSQAKSLASDDPRVDTAYAYMQIRKACDKPRTPEARALFAEAVGTLERVIAARGSFDAYPFHVLGSQGLAWVRRNRDVMTDSETRELLSHLLEVVEAGKKRHSLAAELARLVDDLRRELLMTSVKR